MVSFIFSKVLHLEICADLKGDYSSVLVTLKTEFNKYPKLIDWSPFQNGKWSRDDNPWEGIPSKSSGTNSNATEGNILESINLALHAFDKVRCLV